ncbi:MAG: hypothetical protein GF355_13535 [Candidatus Eisenbacteria bacterium]|nr:hypothetical protein [Candidatus Eisenbacteria bacterium]
MEDWVETLAEWIARHHPTPLQLPDLARRARRALDLPEDGHLILTTNHAAATLAPWNLTRILLGEMVARALRRRGESATAVVTPLDHNTLGDMNRPGVVFLGGRSWNWPGLPRDARRAVCSLELDQPPAAWWERVRDTLDQDAARAHQRLKGVPPLGTLPGKRFRRAHREAVGRVIACWEGAGLAGRSDRVWTGLQAELLAACGFDATRVIGMERVEKSLAAEAPWPAGAWARIQDAARAGRDPWQWSHSLFWYFCSPPCPAAGLAQETRSPRGTGGGEATGSPAAKMAPQTGGTGETPSRSENGHREEIVCAGCGRHVTWNQEESLKAIGRGQLHPRVHLLVLWLRHGVAPIVHTAGPQMVAYAPAVTELERAVLDGSPSPPQLVVPAGGTVPAVVLGPIFLGLTPELERLAHGTSRGSALWRRVTQAWAAGEWPAVEKRLGPRLRDGGFAPGPGEQGVLEAALRDWGWWPPPQPEHPARRLDNRAADLAEGLLAWARPLRWAGGWDWLMAGATADGVWNELKRLSLAALRPGAGSGAPRGPQAPVFVAAEAEAMNPGAIRQKRQAWRRLLSDP